MHTYNESCQTRATLTSVVKYDLPMSVTKIIIFNIKVIASYNNLLLVIININIRT